MGDLLAGVAIAILCMLLGISIGRSMTPHSKDSNESS